MLFLNLMFVMFSFLVIFHFILFVFISLLLVFFIKFKLRKLVPIIGQRFGFLLKLLKFFRILVFFKGLVLILLPALDPITLTVLVTASTVVTYSLLG